MATARATGLPLNTRPFNNRRTGTVSWRVYGKHQGERVRKNFPTEAEAQAWINKRIASDNVHAARAIVTTLPERMLRQAEAAVLRLPIGTDITQAVDFFAAHHRPLSVLWMQAPAESRKEMGIGAIDAYGEWLREQRKCEDVTIDGRKIVLGQFAKAHGIQRSDRITTEKAQKWIYDREVADRTQRDRFDTLNRFCQWLVNKKHAAFNPVSELDRPVAGVLTPKVHTFDQTWTLLQSALTDAEGPAMLPFFAICELSGVRPDEVPRLDGWNDIYLEEEHRIIEVNKAKGGRSRRNVTIHAALWRILTWCKAQGLAPNYFSKRKFNRIRERAKLRAGWQKDICRHTYASHRYVLTKDTKQLTADMGNSERVLFQNYIRPVPMKDAACMEGLCLHYSASREKSRMGTGPKPRKPKDQKAEPARK